MGPLIIPLNSYLHRVLSDPLIIHPNSHSPVKPCTPQRWQAVHMNCRKPMWDQFCRKWEKSTLHSPKPRNVCAPERWCSAGIKGTDRVQVPAKALLPQHSDTQMWQGSSQILPQLFPSFLPLKLSLLFYIMEEYNTFFTGLLCPWCFKEPSSIQEGHGSRWLGKAIC